MEGEMGRRTRNGAALIEDLVSVGPATRHDLEILGVHTVEQLACCDAKELYLRLCAETGTRQDRCVEDVFNAAIAQARDPNLPAEMKNWWFWSRARKAHRD
jgi:hypothetical protein